MRAQGLVARPLGKTVARGANCETGHSGRFVLISVISKRSESRQAAGEHPKFIIFSTSCAGEQNHFGSALVN